MKKIFLIFITLTIIISLVTISQAQQVVLKIWSHWATEENKKEVLYDVARRLEKKYPNIKVEFTWYEKAHLKPALMASIPAGTGPDVYYCDNDWEFHKQGLCEDITGVVNWKNVENWAKDIWTVDGKAYGIQLECWTVELYYNKDIFEQLRIVIPKTYQFTTRQFKDVVVKIIKSGIKAFAAGTADRDYPGFFVGESLLLHALGAEDMKKLYSGELSWKDKRVIEVLNYWKELVDLGAYPPDVSAIKLGESHTYFHTLKKAAMFPMGAFYPGRAFVPPEKGGQPKDFRLGIMLYPYWPGGKGNNLVLLSPGGGFAVSPTSKNKKFAYEFMKELATKETGTLWINKTCVPTGLKVDYSNITENKWYWDMYFDVHKRTKNFVGLSNVSFKGALKDAAAQILNKAFPAGLISVEEAVEKLERARLETIR